MRYIYVVRNLVNGKVYVGQTINPAQRKAGHFCAARKGDDYPLPRAIRKHGQENFSFEVLEECVDEMIDEREKFWIAHFDSRNREKGYNIAIGGRSTTREHHRKLSEALKGNKHCVGRKLNAETRFKMGASNRGKKMPESYCQKYRGHQRQKGERNSQFGKKGERAAVSKLTQAQADEIRQRVARGERYHVIAKDYDVSRFTVSRIANNVIYTPRVN